MFGTYNRFYIYSFNSTRHMWEEVRRECGQSMGGVEEEVGRGEATQQLYWVPRKDLTPRGVSV